MSDASWQDHARGLLIEYAKHTEQFTCAQAFNWCYSKGLPVADSPKSLGPVFKTVLIDSNSVRNIGTCPSTSPQARGRRVALYESVVCQYFMEGDSIQDELNKLASAFKQRKMDVATAIRKAYELGLSGRR